MKPKFATKGEFCYICIFQSVFVCAIDVWSRSSFPVSTCTILQCWCRQNKSIVYWTETHLLQTVIKLTFVANVGYIRLIVWLTFMIFVTQNGVITSLLCAQSRMWQIISKYTCQLCQKCDHYLAVGVTSKASIEISTETCRHPPWPDTNSCQNYQVLCCNIISHEKHVFARARRDSKGWQTTGAEYCAKMFMAVQAGKTRTAKKIYFSQAPVGSSFCERFLLSTVQTVLTELKGTSCLPSASGFIYSLCLFLLLFLQNILIFWQQFYG